MYVSWVFDDGYKQIQLPAGTIRYREAGTGPAIVFVHGYLVDGRLWDGVAEALAGRFHVVVPDLPFGVTQYATSVRVHGETGREALYLNAQYTVGLDGWWPHEAKLLLDYLFAHSTQPAFTCRWRWQAGDVAFWDNRSVTHMVLADSHGHRRAMHRTTVAGEQPIAP